MSKLYPRYSDRVGKGWVVVSVAAVFLAFSTVVGIITSRYRNVKLEVEGPTSEDVVVADKLGENDVPNKAGSVGKEYGEEFAENNYNSVVSQKPANTDNSIVERLLQGSLNFQYMSNGGLIENTYTFDTANNQYTLTHKTPEMETTTVGRYTVGNGQLVLFESANLNPGDPILGTTAPTLEQFADIVYVADDGKIYGTIQGVPCEGTSDVYTAPAPAPTPAP